MKESGVDTKIFKPHSSTSATTSLTPNAKVAIDDVLEQENCTNDSAFCKCYFKEIENSKQLSVRAYY